MNLRIEAILVLTFVIFASCGKEVPTSPIKAGSVRDFPNSLGSTWVYNLTDNLKPPNDSIKPGTTADTVTATIDRYATDPASGLKATVWSYIHNSSLIPEKLVVIRGDTVYFYWSYERNDKIGLIFPFDYRDSWQTGGFIAGDRTTVIDTITMRVPAGQYERVYVLKNERITSISTDKRTMTLWFVPGLGIIKIHLHEEHAQSVGDSTWTLIDHNNPNF